MARSLAALSKRTKTIRTTQKITNAMKLVSMSKLQRFKAKLNEFEPSFTSIEAIDFEIEENARTPLYIIFMPDLGLASNYTKRLLEFVSRFKDETFFVIGSQNFDVLKNMDIEIVNEMIRSDHVDLVETTQWINEIAQDYRVYIVEAIFDRNQDLKFVETELNRKLKKHYNEIYEPSFDAVNFAYQRQYLTVKIYDVYYKNKVVEYTIRRIAMEKATESADSMLHTLKLEYNRLRQERITEEISDLTAMED